MNEAVRACERCGQQNPPAAKFCLECGSALLGAPGRRVREERKVVSVLFADLVDFTAQAERMDPEEVRALLQPYHTGLRADLERYGGTVEKFIGDAVMALFGAPVAHEDDPERAVRAALAIRDRVAAEGRLHVRIGITTGEALVALEARPESGEGMAAGDVVNTASRLQSAAPVDGILVDEATYRATSRSIEYGEHEPVRVKGKSEPVTVYRAQSARARFGVDVRHLGQAPLVGRSREMELLSGALARAFDDRQPQLFTLVGVPGIGKSRIVWELFQRVDAGDRLVSWRQGRSLPYAESISFWALGEVVKAEAGILETDEPDDAAAKLRRAIEAVADASSDVEWMERHLRPLVGLELGAELRGDHQGEAFAAWRHYVEALADRRPLVVVFEDLHWADDGLLDFIDHLVDWVTDVPLLIVGTARPELLSRRPGWGGGKPNALTISLGPLSDLETGALVANLVERAVIPVSVRDTVLERAQGNPLYAEEFARLLAERSQPDDLPETVQGIIAARLDALARDEKELLQDAAVMGKVFWSGALVSMRQRLRAEIEQLLHALERKEFIRRERRASVAGETEYAFRHILVRDVAYGQIPRAERSQRHALAAEWIESLARPADHAELLAQHYLAALEFARASGRAIEPYADRARRALHDAGDRALSLNAFAAAARYFRAALDLMSTDDADRPLVLFGYGKGLRASEEAGADVLAEAESALRSAGNLELAAEAAVLQAELAWFSGDGEATTRHLRRAAELVDGLEPSYSKAYVLSDLSRYYMLRNETEPAIARGSEALAIADELGFDDIKAHALNNIGSAKDIADLPDGLADLERAMVIALSINSPEVARVMNNLSSALEKRGESKRSSELSREALQKAIELGNRSVERFVRPQVVHMDYAQGSWDQALASLDELIIDAAATGGHSQETWNRVVRGQIRLARGDVDGALEDGAAALAAARRAGGPEDLTGALSFMAALLFELGREADARALIDELIEVPRAAGVMVIPCALAMVGLDEQSELTKLVERMKAGRWQDAYRLIAQGRPAQAADLIDDLLATSSAAVVRLHAAREYVAQGRQAEAREQLEKVLPFWRSVRATRYLQQAEEILSQATDPAERHRRDYDRTPVP
ncbi:MAG: AAA family ATPase [Chloroflexota bacterium]|nr:AAA family ATPase [Chloroflexota bacterium]